MFTKETGPFALTVILAAAMTANCAQAQEREEANESPAKIAREVYDLLLAQYRSGEAGGSTQLDLLNNWSERVLMMEFTGSGLADGVPSEQAVKKAIRDHLTRMQELKQIVETKYKAQLAHRADLLAARFFCLEVSRVEQTIQAMQQIFQPVEGDFDIKMPRIDESKLLEAKPPSVVIDIDARGKFSIEGKELTMETLEKQLQQVAKQNPRSASASIRAHPDCLYGNVVEVINVCTKAGIQSISFSSSDE